MSSGSLFNQESTAQIQELDKVIQQAAMKVGAKKENDICHYLPVPTGGYMHHFTLRKMRIEEPQVLKNHIRRYIIETENPKLVLPKKRAARGSRKKTDVISFTQEDLAKVMELARQAGDEEMLAKLNPKRSLSTIKKELISSIKNSIIRQDLWEAYSEQVKSNKTDKQETVIQHVLVES